jgi:hypothetical protein
MARSSPLVIGITSAELVSKESPRVKAACVRFPEYLRSQPFHFNSIGGEEKRGFTMSVVNVLARAKLDWMIARRIEEIYKLNDPRGSMSPANRDAQVAWLRARIFDSLFLRSYLQE